MGKVRKISALERRAQNAQRQSVEMIVRAARPVMRSLARFRPIQVQFTHAKQADRTIEVEFAPTVNEPIQIEIEREA
jgi:hypothetical protein